MSGAPPGLRKVAEILRRFVTEGELPVDSPYLRRAAYPLRTLILAGMRFERDLGRERAAALAYSTLLALIPVFLLGVMAFEFLGTGKRQDVTEWILDLIIPSEATNLRTQLLEYFEGARSAIEGTRGDTGLRLVGVVLLVYFAASLMTSVDRMVASIWGTGTFRDMLKRLSSYWLVITLGPVLLAVSFAGTALADEWVGADAGRFLKTALPFAVTWVSVFLFYRLMPHGKVRTMAALTGAAVAGFLWEASKLVMGHYLAQPKTLVEAMSVFPLILVWMYVSWVIAIYGLEVVYVVHHGAWRPGRRTSTEALSGRARDALTVAVAVEVARAFDEGRFPDREDVSLAVCASEDEVAVVLDDLAAAGLVERHAEGGFRPARGASGIAARELLDASRGAGPVGTMAGIGPAGRVAAEFVSRADAGGSDGLAGLTLADLVARCREPRDGDDAAA